VGAGHVGVCLHFRQPADRPLEAERQIVASIERGRCGVGAADEIASAVVQGIDQRDQSMDAIRLFVIEPAQVG
jgi:hypothetical protein